MEIGFRLLKSRSIKEQLDIISIEKELEVSLPPIYKLFISSFIINNNGLDRPFYQNYYYNSYKIKEKDFRYSPCSIIKYVQLNFSEKFPNNFIILDDFLSIEQTISSYKEELLYSEDDNLKDVICVGSAGPHSGIYVGINEVNRDKVFFIGESDNYHIANNIFEFVRSLEFVSNAEDSEIMQDVPFDKLYKNWNEDFWRVREDEKPS